ncbi:MAG: hypothetical protein M1817_002655 [Caeruleum heppii]|nr:MAG: hypothetical protein M1817_002655 [Caeruleum heppii]
MHFALPPRKTSHPPPYALRSSRPFLRRGRVQLFGLIVCLALTGLFFLSHIYTASTGIRPPGTPEVVIVTPIDLNHTAGHIQKIKSNRLRYAELHGYGTFFPNVTDYELDDAPSGWARVPAIRHAMTLNPFTTYFFHLDQNALIMNPSLSINDHIMSRTRLESLMRKDLPVVPPDSVIKTFSHLRGDHVDLVLTQDGDGLPQGSLIIRQGDWATYFLDSWFDPLYRKYNFQKAEGHALEHIVQWHPTLLAKIAIVPQNIMNSYNQNRPAHEAGTLYKKGDFVIHFYGCGTDADRNCEKELEPFYNEWLAAMEKTT